MSLIVKNEVSNFDPIPEGTHFARCVQMIDLGSQYSETYDKWSSKVMIRWELPNEFYEDKDGNQQPRMIGKTYTKSLGENANLRKMLEGWRGKKFTDEELAGFDLSVLMSLPCMITVTHSTNNGKTYADVSGVAALPKGMEAPAQITESVVYDLDSFEALEAIEDLPEFIQNQIKKSKEWETFTGADQLPATDDDMPF